MKSAREILKTTNYSARILCWHRHLFFGGIFAVDKSLVETNAALKTTNGCHLFPATLLFFFFFYQRPHFSCTWMNELLRSFAEGGNNKRPKSQAASGKVKRWGGTRSWRGSNWFCMQAEYECVANKTVVFLSIVDIFEQTSGQVFAFGGPEGTNMVLYISHHLKRQCLAEGSIFWFKLFTFDGNFTPL